MKFEGTIEELRELIQNEVKPKHITDMGTAATVKGCGFTDNNDGTVTDSSTGLTWLKDANFFDKRMTWDEAIEACNNLNFNGCNWRVPEVDELNSLVDRSQYDPALPKNHPFKNVQSLFYWSASSYVPSPDCAWSVYVYYGGVYFYRKSYRRYVWPVRISPDN